MALALDQSPRATGWAIGRPNGSKPVFGTYRLPEWGDEEGKRMVLYKRWLAQLIGDYRVTDVYIEGGYLPKHSDINAIKPQHFVEAQILTVAAELGLKEPEAVPIDTWRKQAFGFCRLPVLKGEAARKEWKRMAKVLCLKRGHMVEDHNAAEAILILDYGLSCSDYSHRRNAEIGSRRAELQHWMEDRR